MSRLLPGNRVRVPSVCRTHVVMWGKSLFSVLLFPSLLKDSQSPPQGQSSPPCSAWRGQEGGQCQSLLLSVLEPTRPHTETGSPGTLPASHKGREREEQSTHGFSIRDPASPALCWHPPAVSTGSLIFLQVLEGATLGFSASSTGEESMRPFPAGRLCPSLHPAPLVPLDFGCCSLS